MKHLTKVFAIVAIISVATLFSCKKESPKKETGISLSVKPISKEELLKIGNKIKPYLDLRNRTTFSQTVFAESMTDNSSLTSNELAIRNELLPLIENGQQVYEELVSQMQQRPEWQSLTEAERQDILNVNSETQFVDIAIQYSSTGINTESITGSQFMDCLAAVVGVYFIRDTISGIITWPAAMKLAKFIIRRYVSWIALGLTIYDMVECLNG
jgi:hypothetical protein